MVCHLCNGEKKIAYLDFGWDLFDGLVGGKILCLMALKLIVVDGFCHYLEDHPRMFSKWLGSKPPFLSHGGKGHLEGVGPTTRS